MYSDEDYWYIVMELARGGELYDRLTSGNALEKWEVRFMLREMASAVAHIHRCGIVHGDIKPENLLLREPRPTNGEEKTNMERVAAAAAAAAAAAITNATTRDPLENNGASFDERPNTHPAEGKGMLMLADFGSSFRIRPGINGKGDEPRSVKEYTAAYSAPEVVTDGLVDRKADIWSLGVIAYVMVSALIATGTVDLLARVLQA